MADRRRFLKTTLQGGLALGTSLGMATALPARVAGAATGPGQTGPDQTPLPYPTDALEPLIDARTMDIHYTKHAAAYAKNLKDALAAEKLAPDTTMERLLPAISQHSEKMRNNAGGHYNHELFWRCMTPNGPQEPNGTLLQAILSDIGPIATFRQRFTEAAMSRFGSGWAWLYRDTQGKLKIGSTPNQDNPLMDLSPLRGTPLLGLDVWEHAYYLKYQNRRAEYVDNWFKLVNWTFVAQRFDASA